jgi:Spy/CpxP family protein refolding chaperone
MKNPHSMKVLMTTGLLVLAMGPAGVWATQHGMHMSERDEMPMMQHGAMEGMGGQGQGCAMMQRGAMEGMGAQGQGCAMMQRGAMEGMGGQGQGCPMMGGMDMMGSGSMMGGMGMMGSSPMMGGMGMMGSSPMIGGMDLSSEQQTQVQRVHRDLRRQNWENMGRLMEAQEDLQELLAADSPDASAIGEAYARIAELKRPMIEARVKAMNEVRGLLTDEQREQMRSGPHGMGERRPGGMMGR